MGKSPGDQPDTDTETLTAADTPPTGPNPHTAKYDITETVAALLETYTRPESVLPTASICLVACHVILTIVIAYFYLGLVAFLPVAATTALASGSVIIAARNGGIDTETIVPTSAHPSVDFIVNTVSSAMKVPEPDVVVYSSPTPHAKVIPLLTSFHDSLYLTTALIDDFDEAELAAIIAHELGHLKNHDQFYRPYAAVAEFSGMLTGFLIVFAALSHLIGVPMMTTYPYPIDAVSQHVFTAMIGGLIWHSSSGVVGQYRQTSEYTADATALHYIHPGALYTGLLKLNPTESLLEIDADYAGFGSDYPPLRDRLAHIRLRGYTPPEDVYSVSLEASSIPASESDD